uniref:Uncharacterized protein n=1 Tax=Mus musculus TaxID=10090 RepID=Q3V134_MOUSE|nr:unnamed protein product [Mus musculus]
MGKDLAALCTCHSVVCLSAKQAERAMVFIGAIAFRCVLREVTSFKLLKQCCDPPPPNQTALLVQLIIPKAQLTEGKTLAMIGVYFVCLLFIQFFCLLLIKHFMIRFRYVHLNLTENKTSEGRSCYNH